MGWGNERAKTPPHICSLFTLAVLALFTNCTRADTIYWVTASGQSVYSTNVLTGVTSTLITGTGYGPGTNQIVNPGALAVGPDGNIYVGDGLDAGDTAAIVKVTPSGVPTDFVDPFYGGTYGLAFDSRGNLYAPDFEFGDIAQITPKGTETEYASVASGGLAVNHPEYEAFDPAGNLYVFVGSVSGRTQIDFVDKITPAGAVSTFATDGGIYWWDSSGNEYEGTPAGTVTITTPSGSTSTLASGFAYPIPIGLDGQGDLYVWDAGADGVVDKVSPGGGITEVASVPGAFDVVVTPEPDTLAIAPFLILLGRRRYRRGRHRADRMHST